MQAAKPELSFQSVSTLTHFCAHHIFYTISTALHFLWNSYYPHDGEKGIKWIYHGEVSQRGCWTGRARGYSVLPASSSAPARSPPAPRSSGSGSCDWPRVGTCESWHRAGPRRDWWGKRGKCLAACWPPPSGSRGWRKYPAPAKQEGNEATKVRTSCVSNTNLNCKWERNPSHRLNFGAFINWFGIQYIRWNSQL